MTEQTEYPRRFVAGATCAKCKQIDSTVIFSIKTKYHIECIKCGFTQSQDDLPSMAAGKQPLEQPLLRLKRREQD
jgi:uncharacterized metal-binding protein (TIGR02443 family)